MRVFLSRHLLISWQHRLNSSQIDLHHARIIALLHHTRDEGALTVTELPQHAGVLGVSQALRQHLTHSRGGDTAKVIGSIIKLGDLLVIVVKFGG